MGHIAEGNRQQRRAAAKYLRQENAKLTAAWVSIPKSEWPESPNPNLRNVWRNKDFLVQVFREANDVIRLSINRASVAKSGDWSDGISWEQLQDIKNSIGFAASDAVEVFPRQTDEVNVANMRHLWILAEKLPFAWRRKV